jgi:Na+/proline symporter/signal transduction histidine kinase
MVNLQTILFSLLLYIGAMFLLAYSVDKKVDRDPNSKIVNNPFIYCMSLAVYCTSWTFYGSVGKASNSGLLFLTIYLGATLMVLFWGIILRKLVRVKQAYHITSIVDFVSARYDRSILIGVIGAGVVVLSAIPYLALQFKALISTFMSVVDFSSYSNSDYTNLKQSVGIGFGLMMSLFTILFGIRKLDPTERHPGMIFVLAVECVFKLVVFMTIGVLSCYVLNDGYFSVLDKLESVVDKNYSFMGQEDSAVPTWITYMILSGSAIIFLPRQFHVAVIENHDEKHIRDTIWGFPLYMFLINLFVIPISVVGLTIAGAENSDKFVLSIPLLSGYKNLSILTFLGGFAAASGMIMITTMTVTTIISNSVYLPLVERFKSSDRVSHLLLPIRWLMAFSLIMLSIVYVFIVGDNFALVSMGMVSFAGALQFAPIIIGGLFWAKGSRRGATVGLTMGALVWFYTLYFPAFAKSGYIGMETLENGLFGISLLRPEALFGLSGLNPLTHAVFWSMFFNIGSYITISWLFSRSRSEDQIVRDFNSLYQDEEKFVHQAEDMEDGIELDKKVRIILGSLLKYYPEEKSKELTNKILSNVGVSHQERINILKLFELTQEFEKTLTGVIGAAMAHQVIQRTQFLSDEERGMLYKYYSESLAEYNISPKELHTRINFYKEKQTLMEDQFKELEKIIDVRTKELQEKNLVLKRSLEKIEEMQDQLVNQEKMASIGLLATGLAHEIKNPLNFINNGAKLIENEMKSGRDQASQEHSITTAVKMIEKYGARVDNIVNKMLLLSESRTDIVSVDLKAFLKEAIRKDIDQFTAKYNVEISEEWNLEDVGNVTIPEAAMFQVLSIVVDNAICELGHSEKRSKKLDLKLHSDGSFYEISIRDNGNGIEDDILKDIFEPFVTTKQSQEGSGLGLCIANDIVRSKMGEIKINSIRGSFTDVTIRLPMEIAA